MSERVKADLALAFCTLIWGATFVVVKEALEGASVFAFLAARFVLASLLMGVYFRAALRRLTPAEYWAGGIIGVFMFAGYAFQTLGLLYTTPAKAGFITGFSVVLVPVLLAAFWKRKANAWIWAGALAALAGLYFLSVPPGEIGAALGGLNLGDMLVLGCAVMFALHIILVGHYSPKHSVAALSFMQVAATAVLGVIAVPVTAATGLEAPRFAWTAPVLGGILVTAIGATAIAFTIQVWAQKHTSATHTAIIFSLEPVFAALTSYIVLDERLGGRGLIGAALVLAGILLAELKGPTQVAPES
jgi:drug/metabolite transporter (DMT)-like permease